MSELASSDGGLAAMVGGVILAVDGSLVGPEAMAPSDGPLSYSCLDGVP
jgi:hypothetical protein